MTIQNIRILSHGLADRARAVDGLFGASIVDTMRERAIAFIVHGHDAAADDAVGLHALGVKATSFMQIATDRATGTPQRRNLAGARKKAVQATAIGLALIDAIDREIEREDTPS